MTVNQYRPTDKVLESCGIKIMTFLNIVFYNNVINSFHWTYTYTQAANPVVLRTRLQEGLLKFTSHFSGLLH